MQIISIGQLSKYLIYVIIGSLVKIGKIFIMEIKNFNTAKPILLVFFNGISHVLCFIPLLVQSELTNTELALTSEYNFNLYNKDNLSFNLQKPRNLYKFNKEDKKKYILYIWVFIISLLNTFAFIFEIFIDKNVQDQKHKKIKKHVSTIAKLSVSKILEIGVTIILCTIVFKYAFQRHQQFGLILVIIGSGLAVFASIKEIIKFKFEAFYFSGYICFGVTEVIEQWLMTYKYISPYLLLFLNGIFYIPIITIYGLIMHKINKNSASDLIFAFKEAGNVKNKLVFWIVMCGYTIICMIYNICVYLTLCCLGTTYWVVSDFFSIFIIIIIEFIRSNPEDLSMRNKAIILVANLFMLLGSCFYNEVLVLNDCYIGYDTKEKVNLRLIEEYQEAIKDINDINAKKNNLLGDNDSENNSCCINGDSKDYNENSNIEDE